MTDKRAQRSRNASVVLACLVTALACFCVPSAYGGFNVDNDSMMMGIPVGGGSESVDVSMCPQGARVVEIFMSAWENSDYVTMYALLDDRSKEDYSFEDAKFDFQFMEYRRYSISSVRRDEDDFEFILSSGDWQDGDKDTKKMIISGRSFKIITPSRGSIFKRSADSYF